MDDSPAAERYDLDEPATVTMSPLIGAPVVVDVVRIDVGDSVIVVGSMAVETLEFALVRGCFHLDDEESPADWEASDPVNVTLKLRPPIAALFDDGDQLVASLFGEPPTPLRHTEAWLALELTQTVAVPGDDDATAEWGMQTRWADG